MTHYRTLEIEPGATHDDVRAAFRRAARRHHPDAPGGSADRMAEVNEAWRVLGDPSLRRRYDVEIASPTSTAPAQSPVAPAADQAERAYVLAQPARFPWRFMLFMAATGIAFVIFAASAYEPTEPRPVDRVIGPGSCVVFEPNGDAAEALCTDTNDGVVESLIGFDGQCAVGLEGHRDKQGLGIACVRVP